VSIWISWRFASTSPEVGGPLVQLRANRKNEVTMFEGTHCPPIAKTPANPGVERVTGKQPVGQQGGH
jgi:hypothetical protein